MRRSRPRPALFADATAFVPNGDHLANTAPHTVTDFLVQTGSAPGLFLDLNEVDINGTLCGTSPCGRYAAEALFPNSGTYSGNNPSKPFLWDISYGQLSATATGTPKLLRRPVLHPVGLRLVSIKMPKCQTFGQATATLTNVDQVCLQNTTKSGSTWTFRVALLRDIVIPIIGGASGAR